MGRDMVRMRCRMMFWMKLWCGLDSAFVFRLMVTQS